MTDTTPEMDELLGFPSVEAALEAPSITLLATWQELLSNIEAVEAEKIHPQEASRIIRGWPNLKVQELSKYNKLYYSYMRDLRATLTAEIESDPGCLGNIENDAVDNKLRYLNLLMNWQVQLELWSQEWNSDAKDAHISMAALAEAMGFIFGPQGMAHHLDSIQFEFTEEDAELVANAVLEAKGGEGE